MRGGTLQQRLFHPHVSRLTHSLSSLFLALFALSFCASAPAQSSSSSSAKINSQANTSSSTNGQTTVRNAPPPPPSAIDPAGPAVSLETNEPLFDLAAALNTCGYDDGLADSAPVRAAIRNEINAELENSATARDARDQMCTFIHRRDLGDEARNVSQYISLAVYLSPPPELSPTVQEGDMPPDSTGVEGVLPYVRRFARAVDLHVIWLRHRPEYEELINAVHGPLTTMLLETNIYLKQPTSTYDGRRFLVLLEPLLSPGLTNARVYGTDYIVVTSPQHATTNGVTTDTVRLNEIRHTYLHYQIEPLIYTRAGALERMLPFLPIIREAPIDFSFRSDIVAFFTECLIRGIEIRNMDVGIPQPKKPADGSPRYLFDKYGLDEDAWQHQAEAVRRKAVDDAVHQGFVLTNYFYEQMQHFEHDPESLNEDIGEIVYGMELDRELHAAKQVKFYAQGQQDVVQHVPRHLTGLDLADLDMIKGDTEGAAEIAQKVLDSKPSDADAARANFTLGRIDIMERNTEDSITCFKEVIRLSKDPRTLAWAHIYLGRIYDVNSNNSGMGDANLRNLAISEYREALKVRDSQPDTKIAAENGIKQPFALPKAAMRSTSDNDDNTPLDPSGKAEKEAYKPDPIPTSTK